VRMQCDIHAILCPQKALNKAARRRAKSAKADETRQVRFYCSCSCSIVLIIVVYVRRMHRLYKTLWR
jgi:hypothetical protein